MMLWLFSLAVLALLLSPGPNMMFVLSHGIAHGPRAGIAAALGLCAADLVMTSLAVSGVSVAIATWPPFFDLLKLLGAAYLLWLAFQSLRSSGTSKIGNYDAASLMRVFIRAIINSLLNPKALVFFILFLPQFVIPSRGDITLQLLILGCVAAVEALVFHVLLGLFSGRIGIYLNRRPRFAKYQSRALSGVLIALALRLLLLERPVAQ